MLGIALRFATTIGFQGDFHKYTLVVKATNINGTHFLPQMKQAKRSKSPPKATSKKSKKNKKDESSEKKHKKALPDVVPHEVEECDEVLPPPPRNSKVTNHMVSQIDSSANDTQT